MEAPDTNMLDDVGSGGSGQGRLYSQRCARQGQEKGGLARGRPSVFRRGLLDDQLL
jgi:hypothetical protein